jgi:hypothetical protein
MLSAENYLIFSVTDGTLALDQSLISISNGHSCSAEKKRG